MGVSQFKMSDCKKEKELLQEPPVRNRYSMGVNQFKMSDCKKEKELLQEPPIRSNQTLWLIWIVICSSGCLIHTYLVTTAYWNHQVISTTEQKSLTEITPPAMSLCFQIGDVVNSYLPRVKRSPTHEVNRKYDHSRYMADLRRKLAEERDSHRFPNPISPDIIWNRDSPDVARSSITETYHVTAATHEKNVDFARNQGRDHSGFIDESHQMGRQGDRTKTAFLHRDRFGTHMSPKNGRVSETQLAPPLHLENPTIPQLVPRPMTHEPMNFEIDNFSNYEWAKLLEASRRLRHPWIPPGSSVRSNGDPDDTSTPRSKTNHGSTHEPRVDDTAIDGSETNGFPTVGDNADHLPTSGAEADGTSTDGAVRGGVETDNDFASFSQSGNAPTNGSNMDDMPTGGAEANETFIDPLNIDVASTSDSTTNETTTDGSETDNHSSSKSETGVTSVDGSETSRTSTDLIPSTGAYATSTNGNTTTDSSTSGFHGSTSVTRTDDVTTDVSKIDHVPTGGTEANETSTGQSLTTGSDINDNIPDSPKIDHDSSGKSQADIPINDSETNVTSTDGNRTEQNLATSSTGAEETSTDDYRAEKNLPTSSTGAEKTSTDGSRTERNLPTSSTGAEETSTDGSRTERNLPTSSTGAEETSTDDTHETSTVDSTTDDTTSGGPGSDERSSGGYFYNSLQLPTNNVQRSPKYCLDDSRRAEIRYEHKINKEWLKKGEPLSGDDWFSNYTFEPENDFGFVFSEEPAKEKKGIAKVVKPLDKLVFNIAIRNSTTLNLTLLKNGEWEDSVDIYTQPYVLKEKYLVCYAIPLEQLIGKPYKGPFQDYIESPFLELEVNLHNALGFIELYLHDEKVRPLAQDDRIVLYPQWSYTLGYREHVYTFDDDFTNRPCKDYKIARKHEIAECLFKHGTEEVCNERFSYKDCSMTYFKSVLHQRLFHEDMTVKVSLLLEPKKSVTTMIPKTSLAEFVTLVTGIFGFWLGLNLITFNGFTKVVTKFILRKTVQPSYPFSQDKKGLELAFH
ncbi:hypothetical protein HDE_12105 [Halotydeus destructor]|nr:hypothetical protein HDE_12105 [Halotydeus destructor]